MTLEKHIDTNLKLAAKVVAELSRKKLYMATVESCTGGGLAYYITNISGSSSVMEDSFVTYSNEAKIKLGVDAGVIKKHTVYSLETAVAMAETGIARSIKANVGVGITGSIIDVDPANPNSIPGKVYVAVKYGERTLTKTLDVHEDTRIAAKQHIIRTALQLVLEILQD